MKKLLLKIVLLVGSFIFIMRAVNAESFVVNATSEPLNYQTSQHRFSCQIKWIDENEIQYDQRQIQMNQQKYFMSLKGTVDTMILSIALISPFLMFAGIAIKCHVLQWSKQN